VEQADVMVSGLSLLVSTQNVFGLSVLSFCLFGFYVLFAYRSACPEKSPQLFVEGSAIAVTAESEGSGLPPSQATTPPRGSPGPEPNGARSTELQPPNECRRVEHCCFIGVDADS